MVITRVQRLIGVAFLAAVLLFAFKTFVGDVYRISSASMAPVVRVDEYVFVLHDRSVPERFEPVVVRLEGEYLVKRAVGVGGTQGERVRLDAGDLRVDGQKLPAYAPRPPLVVLFDDRILRVEDHFRLGDVWSREPDGTLVLDARDVPSGANAGLMGYVRSLHDGWLEPGGEMVEGLCNKVADAAIEVEFVVREPGGRLRVALLEQRDTFEFEVDLAEEGLAAARIVRWAPRAVLTETTVPFEAGVPIRMRFMNRDDHLSVDWILGEGGFDDWSSTPPLAQASYESNAIARDPSDATSKFERVQFGGEGCVLELRRLRISRDQHWVPDGAFAVGGPSKLQPGELFLLGDNSHESQDSRTFGPVARDRIIGRPLWVVWPWSAVRRVR